MNGAHNTPEFRAEVTRIFRERLTATCGVTLAALTLCVYTIGRTTPWLPVIYAMIGGAGLYRLMDLVILLSNLLLGDE